MDIETYAGTAAYQPRYVAYAAAHGRTPEAMIEHDVQEWPGGKMCGFILWIGRQWRLWRLENPKAPPVLSSREHEQFDRWLESR